MANLNKVMLIGRLGAAPELRTAPDKAAVATMRIATNRAWKDHASGERKEATDWHSVVAFGSQAENCAKYLDKGRLVYVEGRLATRSWVDAEGKTRFRTEVRAGNIRFFDPPRRDGHGQNGGAKSAPAIGGVHFEDDEIPF